MTEPRRVVIQLLGAAALITACGESSGPVNPTVATVTVSTTTDTLAALGEAVQLTAIASDADGTAIPGKTFVWSSSNQAAATVSNTGLATAAMNGAARITASVDGVSGFIELVVHQRAAAVVITPPTATMSSLGDTITLSAVAQDARGNPLVAQLFAWSSGDPAVVSVSPAGLVTAIANGASVVTASTGDVSAGITATVRQVPASVAVTTSVDTLTALADTTRLQALAHDARGNVIANSAFGWQSSDVLVLRLLDADGLITAVGEGTTTISATSDSVVGTAAVTVFQVVVTASIMPDSALMLKDDTTRLVATLLDANDSTVAGRPLTWSSADTSVATVDASGLVSASAAGTVVVTATGDGVTGSADVTVFTVSFASVGTGAQNSCGLATNGDAYCWGSNFWGQIGDGTTENRPVPTAVSGGLTFQTVGVGIEQESAYVCALTPAGDAYCWGRNDNDRLGTGSPDGQPNPVPAPVLSGITFAMIDPGFVHTCGVAIGGPSYCWGGNSLGALGDSSTNNATAPALIAGGLSFQTVGAGGGFSCGLSVAGTAHCWGLNFQGQLGTGVSDVDAHTVPEAVAGGLSFVVLSVGLVHACGLTSTGAVYCWGANGEGQLGDGSTIDRAAPVPVSGGITFQSVSAGGRHTCGVAPGGVLYCWGDNVHSQLGDGGGGSGVVSTTPALVAGGLAFGSVSAGLFHTCGITTTGIAYCWGSNDRGGLGADGPDTCVGNPCSKTPIRVKGQP